ncbi:Hypothetical predicted protein, partial [Paramuricea clavata]
YNKEKMNRRDRKTSPEIERRNKEEGMPLVEEKRCFLKKMELEGRTCGKRSPGYTGKSDRTYLLRLALTNARLQREREEATKEREEVVGECEEEEAYFDDDED